MVNTAFVKIWDKLVGVVYWDNTKNLASFEYDPNFKNFGWEVSPLKMPIKTNQIFTFSEHQSHKTFKGLPGLLADVLPDDYGNQLINNWLVRNGRPENSFNPVELLCFIGTRGMGALEFEPTFIKPNKNTFSLEINELVEASRAMLEKRETFETNINDDDKKAMLDLLKIGTSAGGARPKAIIAFNEKTGQVKSGQTNVPKGFEHWLIKLDNVSDVQFGTSQGYGRIEMAYYLMAKDCLIEMMPCKLIEENGRAHFLTQRFDREGDTKHHIQTLCAMQHYDFSQTLLYSYEQLFQTMRLLKLPYNQAEQMYRRMVFNVVSRNCDDHTKNFAFRLKKDSQWQLAPAYDICFAYRPDSYWVSQHNLSINGKRKDFSKQDLTGFAKKMNIKNSLEIIESISHTVSQWPLYAESVHVNKKQIKQIQDYHILL